MARLQLRRVLRNAVFFSIIVVLYILYSSEEEKHINPVDAINTQKSEQHLQLQGRTLLVDDFWVPEKAFIRLHDNHAPGENGEPVTTSSEDTDKRKKAYQNYGFNQYVSDQISLNRTLPDTRPKE